MLVDNVRKSRNLRERQEKNTEAFGQYENPEEAYSEMIQENLSSVFRDNTQEDFSRAADILIHAEHRYIAGMRGLCGVAAQFGRLLSFILPGVRVLQEEEYPSIRHLQDLTDKDVLFVFAYSRFYRQDPEYVRYARDRNARVCLVTNDITGPLSAFGDVVLIAATAGVSFFHSTISAAAISEYILKLVSDRVDCRNRLEEMDRITEGQLL